MMEGGKYPLIVSPVTKWKLKVGVARKERADMEVRKRRVKKRRQLRKTAAYTEQ
ncbi:unnamed protein product, partial [Sphenostylis stenocarpa]